jgi:hypothetical protein
MLVLSLRQLALLLLLYVEIVLLHVQLLLLL